MNKIAEKFDEAAEQNMQEMARISGKESDALTTYHMMVWFKAGEVLLNILKEEGIIEMKGDTDVSDKRD